MFTNQPNSSTSRSVRPQSWVATKLLNNYQKRLETDENITEHERKVCNQQIILLTPPNPHLSLTKEWFDNQKPFNQNTQIFYYLDVTAEVVENLHHPLRSKLTAEEIDFVNNSSPHVGLSAENDTARAELLYKWFLIIDKLFFFGGLHKHIPSITVFRNTATRDEDDTFVKADYVQEWVEGIKKHEIRINAERVSAKFKGQLEENEEDQIGCLLHEMCHAFLTIYTCAACERCKLRYYFPYSGAGKLSHGKLWANLLHGVATALQRQVRWPVRCGLKQSVLTEALGTRWQPEEKNLVRWRMPQLVGKVEKAIYYGAGDESDIDYEDFGKVFDNKKKVAGKKGGGDGDGEGSGRKGQKKEGEIEDAAGKRKGKEAEVQ